tara:strand:+ start:1153 stop:1596 length:444 start_codon:yes stop_codon:yes gene_type:complete
MAMPLKKGTIVEISGLRIASELNGKQGTIINFDGARYGVCISATKSVRILPERVAAISLKPQNDKNVVPDNTKNIEDENAMRLMDPKTLAKAMLDDKKEAGVLDRAVNAQIAQMRALSEARQKRGLAERFYGTDRDSYLADVEQFIG